MHLFLLSRNLDRLPWSRGSASHRKDGGELMSPLRGSPNAIGCSRQLAADRVIANRQVSLKIFFIHVTPRVVDVQANGFESNLLPANS